MNTNKGRTSRVANQRGGVIVLVVISLVALVGMMALAVDLGILYAARSEAQRAAEAGAHAGAGVLLLSPGAETDARTTAEAFAEANQVRWSTLDVWPDDDIDIEMDEQRVRVRTQRSTARGNPVNTLFARILGFPTVDIGAVAAAQVWPGIATNCIMPFAIPDHWYVNDPPLRDAGIGDVWDEARGDIYYPAAEPGPNGFYTGYGEDRIGQQIQLTSANPNQSPQPGWYYSIRLPGTQGGNDLRSSIRECWEPSGEHQLGDEVDKEPGNTVGPVRQGFGDIFNDPDEQGAYWDDTCKCPRGADGEMLTAISRRVRPIVMFDPRDWPDIANGAKPVPISGFAGVFLESWDGNNTVWVRWMTYTSTSPANEWAESSGSLLRVLRIVE